jgi:nucleotide-binding universal stress UspA family protein
MSFVAPSESPFCKNVLVGVGGSERSFIALLYAVSLARAGRGTLEAVIVEEQRFSNSMSMAPGPMLQHLIDVSESLARQWGGDVARRVRRVASERGMPVKVTRVQGRVTDGILNAAQRASVVVLGKRGHQPEAGDLLGPNTELIVRGTHKPVLLTPDHHVKPKRILLTYAGKALGPLLLATGAAMAGLFKAPLEVFTVGDQSAQLARIQEQARLELSKINPNAGSVSFRSEAGDPATTIAHQTAIDTLLVMGAYGHSRLYRMTLGSVTEQVIRESNGPVLLTGKHVAASSTLPQHEYGTSRIAPHVVRPPDASPSREEGAEGPRAGVPQASLEPLRDRGVQDVGVNP